MNEVVVKEKASLDELMLAMDVVDTLRHKELVLARELEGEDRDAKLLEQLREIYTAKASPSRTRSCSAASTRCARSASSIRSRSRASRARSRTLT